MSDDYKDKPHRPLRETVCEIDRDILRLVMRRQNLIQRMAGNKGFLSPQEERYLRESWEAQAAKVSSDPKLSSRFFALMQEVKFLSRPENSSAARPPAFGLAPSQQPVRLQLDMPASQEQTQLWCYMAAASGQKVKLNFCLMNDSVYECIRMFNQLGAALTRSGDSIEAEGTKPAQAPDKVIGCGGSALNFYLCVAHYLGRPGHAKFMGGPELKLADFSPLRRFLPAVGARFVSLVPRSEGLPARLESAGIAPDVPVVLPDDLPDDFMLSLLVAAPFYPAGLKLDVGALNPARVERVAGRARKVLDQTGIRIADQNGLLVIAPFKGRLPEKPLLDMDTSLAAVLLILGLVCGGSVSLSGSLPEGADSWLAALTASAGTSLVQGKGRAGFERKDRSIPAGQLAAPAAMPQDMLPLLAALACVQALRDGSAAAPACLLGEGSGVFSSFAGACGLLLEDGQLTRRHEDDEEHGTPSWTAPTAIWACALAAAACARPFSGRGFQLSNPGILTGLWPDFWSLYNALPEPALRQREAPAQDDKPRRRRIRTQEPAQLTPLPIED